MQINGPNERFKGSAQTEYTIKFVTVLDNNNNNEKKKNKNKNKNLRKQE